MNIAPYCCVSARNASGAWMKAILLRTSWVMALVFPARRGWRGDTNTVTRPAARRAGSSLRRLLNVEHDGLQDELEAEDERQHRDHDRPRRRRVARRDALRPLVRAEEGAPRHQQQPGEEEERDGREV